MTEEAEAPSNIVMFPGVTRTDLPHGAQPSEQIIEMLEELLQDAREGRLRAASIARVEVGHVTTYEWYSPRDNEHELWSAISDMHFDFGKRRSDARLAEEEDGEDDPSGGTSAALSNNPQAG